MNKSKQSLIGIRDQNKSAKVGSLCVCPSCKSKFIKESYQQCFCKLQVGTICKDNYWNNVTPSKRSNTTRGVQNKEREKYYNYEQLDDGMDYLLECGCRE